VLSDQEGFPVELRLEAAQRHDLYACTGLIEKIPAQTIIVADRGYDAQWFRQKCRKRGLKPLIPKREMGKNKKKKTNDPITRMGRWRCERLFAWMAKFRKLQTRYERHSKHYEAFWYLGFSVLLLGHFNG